ncbi:PTS transporter subunit EIIC [Collinsella aerofaciens]|uniref:PTS transporter subunit EIIC n=1 Tax=Collinsella aerofaciens TaxID=74426 RepID=UPI00232AA7CD|nr:PTS transporter subunit EIIC [Collinsella aerofaciens]MDB1903021.1 PTS transporter subunit EIIC [Collinsella aerofaciens]
MADITKLAAEILEMVGGAENITFVAHCMTRLRFNLKDESIVDDAKDKAIDGVIDIRHSAGQYQVIVGPKVDKVYEIVAKETGIDTGKSAADEGETKGFLGKLMKLISGIMMPVLPALIACGMINAVLSILTTAGVVSAESGIYTMLYGMGNACMYFLPVLVGSSAAKFFGIDQYIGAVLGAILIYPTFVAAAGAGDALDLFGVKFTMVSYASTVFPAIVAAWFASVLYKWLRAVLPDALAFALVPFLTVAIAAPISLLVVGPVIQQASSLLATAVLAVYQLSPVLCGVILGPIFGLVMIPLGLHWALIVISINNIMTVGSDPILGLLCGSMGVVGACLAFALRSKDPGEKSLGFSCAITSLCGITEPALYGIVLEHKKIIIASMISGAISAVIPAIFNTRTFVMTSSGIFSFPGYMNPSGDMSSLIGAILCNVVGFILTFVLVYIMYRPDADVSAE